MGRTVIASGQEPLRRNRRWFAVIIAIVAFVVGSGHFFLRTVDVDDAGDLENGTAATPSAPVFLADDSRRDPARRESSGANPKVPTAMSKTSESTLPIVLAVVDRAGIAVPRATVVLWSESEPPVRFLMDDDGRRRIADPGQSPQWIAFSERHPPTFGEKPRGSEWTIVVDDGAVLSGTIIVDGRRIEDVRFSSPLEFSLHQADRRRPSAPNDTPCDFGRPTLATNIDPLAAFDLPSSVREYLDEFRLIEIPQVIGVQRDGTFRVPGLPVNWSGQIGFSPLLEVVGTDRLAPYLDLLRPKEGLEIRLRRLPSVLGRIVHTVTKKPLPLVDVSILYETGDLAAPHATSSYQTGIDGSFRIAMRTATPRNVRLTVSSPGFSTTMPIPDPTTVDVDTGDIAIDPPSRVREIVVDCRDENGGPLAGARVFVDGYLERPVATANDGKALLSLPNQTHTLVVGMFGRRSVTIEVPRETTAPVDVVLAPTAAIEVRLPDLRGRTQKNRGIVLFADGSPLGDESGDPPTIATNMLRNFRSGDRHECYFVAGADGRAEINDVATDRDIFIAAVDRLGRRVSPVESVRLAPGERRRLTITTDLSPRDFRGRVIDSSGEPVGEGSVRLFDRSTGGELRSPIDALGRFRVVGVDFDRADVEINVTGRDPRILERFEIPTPNCDPIDLRLD